MSRRTVSSPPPSLSPAAALMATHDRRESGMGRSGRGPAELRASDWRALRPFADRHERLVPALVVAALVGVTGVLYVLASGFDIVPMMLAVVCTITAVLTAVIWGPRSMRESTVGLTYVGALATAVMLGELSLLTALRTYVDGGCELVLTALRTESLEALAFVGAFSLFLMVPIAVVAVAVWQMTLRAVSAATVPSPPRVMPHGWAPERPWFIVILGLAVAGLVVAWVTVGAQAPGATECFFD